MTSPDTNTVNNETKNSETTDNSNILYVSLLLPCGVEVKAQPGVLSNCPAIIRKLNEDIQDCLGMLPKSVHSLIKRTKIWINESYMLGPGKPKKVDFSTAHHDEGWLLWARDNPAKARGIEIYDCYNYLKSRLHWNGCGLILHEFCHLIHQVVFLDGLDNDTIKKTYERAKLSGKYKHILRRDWAGRDVDYDQAYAMVNHKEFFAEMSVSYLCCNYIDLDKSKTTMNECCPPLTSPNVIETVKKHFGNEKIIVNPSITKQNLERLCGKNSRTNMLNSISNETCNMQEEPWNKIVNAIVRVFTLTSGEQQVKEKYPPCNKFYPFTRGQFAFYDPELIASFEKIWTFIQDWDDEFESQNCRFFRC